MNHLSAYIGNAVPKENIDIQPMPLIHTTSAYTFRDIIRCGMKLQPSHDHIFRESLIYLYYGKPVYSQIAKNFSSFNHTGPVYFILSHSAINRPKRIFPFDSGAFAAGMYSNYISPNMKLSDFELRLEDEDFESSYPSTLTRFVKAIYGDNRNYFLNRPAVDIRFDPLNYELEVYLNLVRSKESAIFDERHSTIEIQADTSLQISEQNCHSIIFPDALLRSSDVSEFLHKNPKILPLHYSTFRSDPKYYSALAVSLVGQIMEEQRVF